MPDKKLISGLLLAICIFMFCACDISIEPARRNKPMPISAEGDLIFFNSVTNNQEFAVHYPIRAEQKTYRLAFDLKKIAVIDDDTILALALDNGKIEDSLIRYNLATNEYETLCAAEEIEAQLQAFAAQNGIGPDKRSLPYIYSVTRLKYIDDDRVAFVFLGDYWDGWHLMTYTLSAAQLRRLGPVSNSAYYYDGRDRIYYYNQNSAYQCSVFTNIDSFETTALPFERAPFVVSHNKLYAFANRNEKIDMETGAVTLLEKLTYPSYMDGISGHQISGDDRYMAVCYQVDEPKFPNKACVVVYDLETEDRYVYDTESGYSSRSEIQWLR